MKMVQKELIKRTFLLFFCSITFHSILSTNNKENTWNRLVTVNKNWLKVKGRLSYTYTPKSEKELVQLHLLNVISYLKQQKVSYLNEEQQNNRALNIDILYKYCLKGDYPINNITTDRTPIFIDYKGTHCAVGYLLKGNGLGIVSKEIAQDQLLAYLPDIKHAKLINWQKSCGLSFFELSLIQPTYGPPIYICASPSPVKWNLVKPDGFNAKKLFTNNENNSIYRLVDIGENGLNQKIQLYSNSNEQWKDVGTKIKGQIQDLIFSDNEIYLSVFLTEENYPHQLLQLNKNRWKKIAHFNGNIISIQPLQNKLYILGNFNRVNDSIFSEMVVINKKTVLPFKPVGLGHVSFKSIKSSETCLFLTDHRSVYKMKYDTINHLANINYYQYISDLQFDAVMDTLFMSSPSISGYNKYYSPHEEPFYLNTHYDRNHPFGSINFTKCQVLNGNMIIAGDFKSSTLIPQVNDNRSLITCPNSENSHWYGEGLLYHYGNIFYPILNTGVVQDFVAVNKYIYILKNDGDIYYTSLDSIEQEINQLKKQTALNIEGN